MFAAAVFRPGLFQPRLFQPRLLRRRLFRPVLFPPGLPQRGMSERAFVRPVRICLNPVLLDAIRPAPDQRGDDASQHIVQRLRAANGLP